MTHDPVEEPSLWWKVGGFAVVILAGAVVQFFVYLMGYVMSDARLVLNVLILVCFVSAVATTARHYRELGDD